MDVGSIDKWMEALLVLEGMVLNHVTIIVLTWNVSPSSLVLVVGLISG